MFITSWAYRHKTWNFVSMNKGSDGVHTTSSQVDDSMKILSLLEMMKEIQQNV